MYSSESITKIKNEKDKKRKKFMKKRLMKMSTITEVASPSLELSMKDEVLRLALSPRTQHYIGCQIGEKITHQNPWIYVKKEDMLDDIASNELESELISIMDFIINYPEPELLIGSYGFNQHETETFLLCLTIQSKNNVLRKLENEKEAMRKKLISAITMVARPWKSLGSDIEINEERIFNIRPLFQLEIESNFPIVTHSVKFSFCHHGYVELLPNRNRYMNVFRKRVEKGIQKHHKKLDMGVQTELLAPLNKYTQYEYHFKIIDIAQVNFQHLNTFLQRIENEMNEIMVINYKLNLFNNDFDMKNAFWCPRVINLNEPVSFKELVICKKQKVASMCWYYFSSGIIAASYTKTPSNFLTHKERICNQSYETVFQPHLVLIWNVENHLYPNLYLHSMRDVTALSFCPYDPNIIIGGCKNGQIVVWDITNKFTEKLEIFTHQQLRLKSMLKPLTHWFKYPPNSKNVFPAVISNIEFSHKSSVEDIKWIPSDYYLNNFGKYTKCDPNYLHRQFVTSGFEDGIILVWDLIKKIDSENFVKNKVRSNRLTARPAALSENKSPLIDMHKNFIPVYKFKVVDSRKGNIVFVNKIILRNEQIKQKIENPEKLGILTVETNFKYAGRAYPFNFTQDIFMGTATGQVFSISWEGTSFDQGQKFTTELIKDAPYVTVHDGPIVACHINPFEDSIILCVGGRIFSIWDRNNVTQPIIWRKSIYRYMSGDWTTTNPCSFLLAREDNLMEVWNIFKDSKSPVKLWKYRGNVITSFCNDNKYNSTWYSATDTVGNIRLIKASKGFFNAPFSEITMIKDYLNTFQKARDHHNRWLKSYKARQTTINETKAETSGKASEKRTIFEKLNIGTDTKQVDPNIEDKYVKKQEEFMAKALIKRRRLNLVEIANQEKYLKQVLMEERKKLFKVKRILKKKDEIFEHFKEKLTSTQVIQIKEKIKISFPEDVVVNLQKKYIQNYINIEMPTIEHIKKNRFRYVFEWNEMLTSAKQRMKDSRTAIVFKENYKDDTNIQQISGLDINASEINSEQGDYLVEKTSDLKIAIDIINPK